MARDKVLGVRLSAGELGRLAAAAAAAGTTAGALARRLVDAGLSSPLAPTLPPIPPAARAASEREPLCRIVAARLTAPQHDELEERATSAGLAVGSFLRHLVLGLPPPPRRPLTRAAIVALNRVGNNLNQLTKLAHGGTLLPAQLADTLHSLHQQVRALRQALEREP